MDWWIALIPLLLSIGVVYFTLFQGLKYLFQKHRFWFVAAFIFMAPFGFVLAQATSVIDVLWMFTLTPFYAVFILLLVATAWIIRFYCFAYAVLILAEFVFRQRALARKQKDLQSYEPFWQRHFKAFAGRKVSSLEIGYRKTTNTFWVLATKYWTLAIAIALLLVAASTLVSARVPRDPTYAEAMRFVASDITDGHPYVIGEYMCGNFSSDLQANAQKAGFKCGIVTVFFVDGSKHAINCFNTADAGTVYIEPQTDQVVTLTINEIYLGAASNFQVQNATVAGFSVNWLP